MSNEVEWKTEWLVAKEKTFWEKAVGYTFNPSWDSKVYQAKRLFATVIDLIHDYDNEYEWQRSYLRNLFSWAAIRSCITAQMAVVKFLTWKD
jgi:hypothetical protein